MIKHQFWILGIACANLLSAQDMPDGLMPFNPSGVEIQWNIPEPQTNTPLKVFRIVRHPFDATVVSNLLEWGGLSEQDKVPQSDSKSDVLFFQSKEHPLINLVIVPSNGCVKLNTEGNTKFGHEGDVVPTIPQVIQWGSNMLVTVFGISTNELDYKEPEKLYVTCSEGKRESFNHKLRKRVKAITDRGVHFYRAIDGYPVLGVSGASVDFGEYGKVYQFRMLWRNIEPSGELPRPPLSYFEKAVTNGGAFVLEGLSVKRLVFQSLDYCYSEKFEWEQQDFFRPFARLAALAYDGNTNTSIYVVCPLPDPAK